MARSVSPPVPLARTDGSPSDAVRAEHRTLMLELIEEFSLAPISSRENKGCMVPALPFSNVFLFTGATGHLGSDILAQLLADDKVSRIFALNRPSYQGSSADRVKRRFLEKGLDVQLLQNGKIVYIDGDVTKPDFGLDKATFEELLRNTTTVLHNAWPIKFTRSLAQYRPSIIGLHNLLKFAHQSQKTHGRNLRFLFVSSFAAGQSWSTFHFNGEAMPEDILVEPNLALGMGYGESKFVGEHIVARSGLNATSIRVGQLCGRTTDGAWSTSEWAPLLLRESIAIGALPNVVGKLAFLPLDVAAQFMRDISLTVKELPTVLNLRHHHIFEWDICLHAVQHILPQAKRLPVIRVRDWNALLADRAAKIPREELNKHPVVKLSNVYSALASLNESLENAPSREQEHFPYGTQDIAHAMSISPSLQIAGPVTKHDAERWASYWLRIGFFDPNGLTIIGRAHL